MGSNEFVKLLLLDGFFILIYILATDRTHDYFFALDEDPNTDVAQHYRFIDHDILLLENQLPFFVLKMLYERFIGEEDTSSTLSENCCRSVEQILRNYPISIKETNRPKDFHHLLHLCHIYLKPSRYDDSFEQDNQTMTTWRSAVQYQMAGVKFQKREYGNYYNRHSLMDVGFKNNVLEIPYLIIDENTPSLFMNLIALERRNPEFGNDITTYIVFMSQLISSAEDVALLVSKGIIEHDLRSQEEVESLFKRLSEGVIFDF